MNNEFSEDKIKEIKEAFDMFDYDKDNKLNREEFENVLLCLGYNFTHKEITDIIIKYGEDSDNFGRKINYDQYGAFLSSLSREIEVEGELMECFMDYDKDGDGRLNTKELKYAMLLIGERFTNAEIEELISQVDTTGEGGITYKDFVKLMLTR
jgi:Ca2+-binding EF-hand superfamily protein